VFEGECLNLLKDGMSVELFTDCYIKVLETAGHNKGCLSFIIKEGIFTGDSLIPGIPVVTKLKSGNKEDAIKSILKIQKLLGVNQIIFPGHGPIFKKLEVDWSLYN
jgi:glyoxylase-like metal-dependent hydrolase (beta-lactamase superfamily II)